MFKKIRDAKDGVELAKALRRSLRFVDPSGKCVTRRDDGDDQREPGCSEAIATFAFLAIGDVR